MPAPPEPKVTGSKQLWSTEVALADALDAVLDSQQGITNVVAHQPYPDAYEFSSGRKFKDGKGPYA
jgi:hypothetical protein